MHFMPIYYADELRLYLLISLEMNEMVNEMSTTSLNHVFEYLHYEIYLKLLGN